MASRRAPRRQMQWATFNLNSDMASGSTTLQQLNSTLSAADQDNTTLIRTIICVRLLATTPGSNTNAQLVAFGVGVASTEGFGAGAGAVASPAVAGEEPQAGWVYQCQYWVIKAPAEPSGFVEINIDLRSQRKIGNGVPFIRVDNNVGSGTAFNMRAVGNVRTLYKLS